MRNSINGQADCNNCLDNNNSIFSTLTASERDIVFNKHNCSFYKKGQIVYKEGDKPTGLLCLSEGKMKIFKEGVGGREQIVRMAKPVGFIGYRALFAEENYIASAMAIEDSSVCIIDKDTLYMLLKQNPNFALSMIKALATELGFSNSRTVTLTQKHIRGRLAESLLFLLDTYGFEEDGETIKVYLPREDLANLSNMTTSNAIRTLSIFANEGVIELSGRQIKIIDLATLKRISQMG